jgi:tetratricopeptide (TPR) repeat protein
MMRGMKIGWRLLWAIPVLQTQLAWSQDDGALGRATAMVARVEAESGSVNVRATARNVHKPESFLISGEFHLKMGQNEAAILDLSKVLELVERAPASEAMAADAHYLIASAYLETGELHSARRHFEIVTDHVGVPAYARWAPRAAARLVDVALGLDREDLLPAILARIEQTPESVDQAALGYAKGKVLVALGRYEEASRVADSLSDLSGVDGLRAAYLRGVAALKRADLDRSASGEGAPVDTRAAYDEAIAVFSQATSPAPSAGAIGAEISDLAWLAIARLHYEKGRYGDASRAYQRIPRTSKHFPTALFELAWTYVRSEDFERAQRVLEVLKVLEPGLIDGADAALLRGDLSLRSGRFPKAEQAYQEARALYAPLYHQAHEFLEENLDPAIYYDQLTASPLEVNSAFPKEVLGWVREEARGERVFAIVDDVARARRLISQARRLATLTRAALGSDSRAKVFPTAEKELERVIGLLNQLAVARVAVGHGMDGGRAPSSGQVGLLRQERNKLAGLLGDAPSDPGDFTVRASDSDKAWNGLTQELQRLELEADSLNAVTNGLRRMLRESERYGVQATPEALARFRQELAESEREMATYARRIAELRKQAEIGRAQSGLGDPRFAAEADVRQRLKAVLTQEVQLVMGGADPKARPAVEAAIPILRRIDAAEAKLAAAYSGLQSGVTESAQGLSGQVESEALRVEGYAQALDALDESSRVLVGEVARENFAKVRDRIEKVVMRADVGLVQKSWEVREEQLRRVKALLRERAREDKYITDELREVLEDAEGGQ